MIGIKKEARDKGKRERERMVSGRIKTVTFSNQNKDSCTWIQETKEITRLKTTKIHKNQTRTEER